MQDARDQAAQGLRTPARLAQRHVQQTQAPQASDPKAACAARLVRGPVKFNLSGTRAHILLRRNHLVYAIGARLRNADGHSRLLVSERHPLGPGTYTLLVKRWRGHRRERRRERMVIGRFADGAESLTSSMMRLDGTRALISGGSSGLGRAMAAALVQAGARVVLTSRIGARAAAVAAELGAGAIGLELDAREERSVHALVEEAWRQLGGIYLLVNNAGIGMRTVNPRFMSDPQPFWKVTPAGFRDVIDTKVAGTFLLTRELVVRMLAAGGGQIVNISMNKQTMTRRGFVPYGPSGAALEALSHVMAADLAGTSVRVNLLLPGGATATGMIPEQTPSELRAALLDPAIMGPAIVWLAGRQAADLHDQRIVATELAAWLKRRAGRRPGG